MPDVPCILVIDDDRTIREALASTLEEAGYAVRATDGVKAGLRLLQEGRTDAVLLDIRLKDGDGLALLAELRRMKPGVPVIMATAYGDSERTIRAMKEGAFDYVTKPFNLEVLLASVARAVRTPPVARVERHSEGTFIGSSPAMLEVWKAIGRAAASDVPVLITGESGVGKELVAQAIHAHSARRAEPFVAVNIAALSPSLIESELFGHEKGAFTGATLRREGRFELAARGTLFLDEMGEMDLALQSKLLRVLEDGRFERVGGTEPLVSQARILAATSRPVTPGAPQASLRDDLYYRMGVVRIEVPPLRKRRQDIPLLVDAFLRRASAQRRAVSEAAMRHLVSYDWPGNVRQLLHAVENACVMSTAEVLDVADFEPRGAASQEPLPEDSDLDLTRNLERLERRLLERALESAKGNRAQAARLLGIRRALLYARMKHLGLS
ncbi:MAG TPA: sigma-54 dependent transcriptional regulator [Archangium sp.]|uniref:sigma-54-dependent transcriptional regulator n=1 Tax=Archangium sp. TaxID=1872627 RepID=UPI002E327FF1|nr:sigma-54 dependent transcriptional regulator [Archangium sp.]HEX5749690.1 sigma-54 dependent transcriptional regulator [Archangium sp.]